MKRMVLFGIFSCLLLISFSQITVTADIFSDLSNNAVELTGSGQYDEALETYDQIDPSYNPTVVLMTKGEILDRLGRYEEALDVYKQAYEIETNEKAKQFIYQTITNTTRKLDIPDIKKGRNPVDHAEATGDESTSTLPDLTITKLSMKQKDNVVAGTLTIANKGGDAGEFTVEYFLTDTYYPEKTGGNVTVLGSDTVHNLGSGQERDASDIKMFTIPGSLSPGTYWVGAYIDPEEQVAESDEGNNIRYDIGMVEIGE